MFTKYFKLPAFAKSCSLNCVNVTLDRVRCEPWNIIGHGHQTEITYLNKLKLSKEFNNMWMEMMLAQNLDFYKLVAICVTLFQLHLSYMFILYRPMIVTSLKCNYGSKQICTEHTYNVTYVTTNYYSNKSKMCSDKCSVMKFKYMFKKILKRQYGLNYVLCRFACWTVRFSFV